MTAKQKGTMYTRMITNYKNKTGLAGVKPWRNDYKAVIKFKGRLHEIGIFATPESAHRAYLRTCKALGIKLKVKPNKD